MKIRTFRPSYPVLGFYSAVATAALLLVLVARPPVRAFGPEEARTEGARLAELARSTRLSTPRRPGPVHMTWSPAPGGYRGLGLRPQWRGALSDAGPEVHLAVRLVVDRPAALRSPERPPLPRASLVRERAASDLVDPGRARVLRLEVAPGVGATGGLAVDNVRGEAGRSAAGVGRPWSALDPVTPPPTAVDLQVFDALARTLRARVCGEPEDWATCGSATLLLARDPDPRSYRVTLVDPAGRGELPFEIAVRTVDRRLSRARLRPLPGATLRAPADLFVLPPRGSRDVVAPSDPGVVAVSWRPGDAQWRGRRWDLDLETVLAGTAW